MGRIMIKIDWKSWFREEDIIIKVTVTLIAVLIFCIGMATGVGIAYRVLNDCFYDEMRSADSAIWIRIDAIEGEKDDLMERIDRLAQIMDQYDLAVAQIKVYEKRKEIMNVRFSDKD